MWEVLVVGVGVGLVLALVSNGPMLVSALRRRSGGLDSDAMAGGLSEQQQTAIQTLLNQISAQDVRISAQELEMRVLREWVAELSAQLVELGQKPITEYQIRLRMGLVGGSIVSRPNGPVVDGVRLAQIMARSFSLAEMQSLAFGLGVDWEAIPGATAQRKADELVGYMRRIGRLRDLDAATRRERPKEFE